METSRKASSPFEANITPIYLAQELHRRDLFYFTSRDLADLFALASTRVYRLVQGLKKSGLIVEVENGKYLLLGFEPERVLGNPLFIAAQIVTPGYVSYWSALHYYGFTEQVPRAVTVATTKKKRPVIFRNQEFRYVTIRPGKLFGSQRVLMDDLPVELADEAKAIIDSLDQPRYAGGMSEVAKALRAALPTVDIGDLVSYANQMDDRSLCSRLGYLLDVLAEGLPDGPTILERIQALIPAQKPIKLDPTRPRAGAADARSLRWRVIPNLSPTQLIPEGVV